MMGDVVEQRSINATGAGRRTSWPPQWSISKGHTPIPTGSTQGRAKPSLLRLLLRRVLVDTPGHYCFGDPLACARLAAIPAPVELLRAQLRFLRA